MTEQQDSWARYLYADYHRERAREYREGERERERLLESQRAAERARQDAYRIAASAAERAGATITDKLRELQRHAVDLAAEKPAIVIHWLKPGTRSWKMVTPVGALAFIDRNSVVVEPITSTETYVGCLHELGHCRTPRSNSKLDRERLAWAWAREHSKIWDQRAQDLMTSCLESYLIKVTERGDTIEVLAIERLCSRDEFCHERQRRLMKELKLRR
jgi:hypothetical protein